MKHSLTTASGTSQAQQDEAMPLTRCAPRSCRRRRLQAEGHMGHQLTDWHHLKWAVFKIPFDLLSENSKLTRSLRSLKFSKILLATQQLQRTSLRISYGKLSRQTKEWSFSEKHVLGRCIFFYCNCSGQVRQMRLTKLIQLKKIKVPQCARGHWKATFAYDSLTDAYAELTAISDLRFGFCEFWFDVQTIPWRK